MKNLIVSEYRMVGLIVGFLATIMIFLPALGVQDSDSTYTGLQVVFGHEFLSLGGFGSGEITFSMMNLIAYTLPLIAALVLMFTKVNQLFPTILFGAAAVLLFLVPQFTVVTVSLLGTVTEVDVEWTYASGIIIAALLSIIGFAIGIFKIYKKA